MNTRSTSKKFVIITILVLVCCVLSSCGGENDLSKSILGAWEQDKDASDFTITGGQTLTPYLYTLDSLLFRDGGLVDYGDIVAASYAVNGNSLTIKFPYSSTMETYTIVSITDTEMVLTQENSIVLNGKSVSGTYHFTYIRQ